MRLAVIDNHPHAWAATLVPYLELLGYSRYWATEQHGPSRSGSPVIMAAIAGTRSKKIRIGTAGVALKINGVHRVLADFKVLQFYNPGRIDMGFIQQAPPEPLASRLRNHPLETTANGFADDLRRLVAIVRGEDPEADDHITPGSLRSAELWLCGSSSTSARLAAQLGIHFAYHDNRYVGGPGTGPRIKALVDEPYTDPARVYLEEFRPHASSLEPRLSLACYGICAETSARAQALWQREAGRDNAGKRWRAGFCGTPQECREQLLDLQGRYGAHEIAVQALNRDLTSCLSSYALLAAGCLAEQTSAPTARPDRTGAHLTAMSSAR